MDRALHRLPAASDLPTLLAQFFVALRVEQLKKIVSHKFTYTEHAPNSLSPRLLIQPVKRQPDAPAADITFWLYVVLSLIHHLSNTAHHFGPASFLSFHIEPNLSRQVDDIAKRCWFAAVFQASNLRPGTEDEDFERNHDLIPSVKPLLTQVRGLLGQVDGVHVKMTPLRERVLKSGRTPDAEEKHECEMRKRDMGADCDKEGELMQCSKVRRCLLLSRRAPCLTSGLPPSRPPVPRRSVLLV